MKKRPILLASSHVLLALQFIAVSAINATEFSGPVVAVLDGDTIEVLHNNRPERIRLNGIDCPEKGQAYEGKASDV